MLLRKVFIIFWILAAGLVLFGLLPKRISDPLARGLAAVMIVGFVVRVGAYLLSL